MADKDVDQILDLLAPLARCFVAVAADLPRAMPAQDLAREICARGGQAQPAASIPEGVALAVQLAGDGPVCALGTLYFSGDVQMVGFRYQAKYAADDLGLTGWVCNLCDGRVEMEVQGRDSDIDRLLARLYEARSIRITDIEARRMPLQPGEKGFRVTGY